MQTLINNLIHVKIKTCNSFLCSNSDNDQWKMFFQILLVFANLNVNKIYIYYVFCKFYKV